MLLTVLRAALTSLNLAFVTFFYVTRLILRTALRRFNRLNTADVTLTPLFKVVVTISVVINVGIAIAISINTAISVSVSVIISISVSVNAAISINVIINTGVIIGIKVVTGIRVATGIKTTGINVTNAAVNTTGKGTGVTLNVISADTITTIKRLLLSKKSSSSSLLKFKLKLDSVTAINVTLTAIIRVFLSVNV